MIVVVCLQVFGKGNTVFWIVFSVIHILATLLLSTQLYYMGRWRLGKITARNGLESWLLDVPGGSYQSTSAFFFSFVVLNTVHASFEKKVCIDNHFRVSGIFLQS